MGIQQATSNLNFLSFFDVCVINVRCGTDCKPQATRMQHCWLQPRFQEFRPSNTTSGVKCHKEVARNIDQTPMYIVTTIEQPPWLHCHTERGSFGESDPRSTQRHPNVPSPALSTHCHISGGKYLYCSLLHTIWDILKWMKTPIKPFPLG